ncbi:hypothetical protein BT96DRAFT_929121 [Gymnopus androsaceus JB14]|uniref:Ubiquitin 3 binding protein But2 C-terminal domain-containing protein n=1 Tax=Gymnopus androsaceus JB14 TaxID=1447944 RepID=A0A6A4GH09_9AGAR|nr:hypothetical protein BT96DRAFT_929121 [Gymnopus androsaceus JB14]
MYPFRNFKEYMPIAGHDDSAEENQGYIAQPQSDYFKLNHYTYSPWAVCFIVLSIALAVWNLKFSLHRPLSRSTRLECIETLYRPNIYIGLDRVSSATAREALPAQIDRFPHVFAPVDRMSPNHVFPSDGRARITFNGLVSPGEPLVIINEQTMMIGQMRIQDHNLLRCAFVSTIPNITDLEMHNRKLLLNPNSVKLGIWELDSSGGELDLTTLSWKTRPQRTRFLSELTVELGREHHSTEFSCGPSGRLFTFELSCIPAKDGCTVEFWQEQPETYPRMAIILAQRPAF